ncbi:polysaccharide biosynthesis/export family protein [Pedobacter cryoconitis]|uniref:Polysaccharide export outer membrane protein n=1 Tax=Pedobacter cryoconitis TaxID=188932 RepID=A0A7X0MJG0_9SPHI|nr:polysaccharide biosynthesis/export family protein [Pedobacter cryoconitis]MBB6500956.1 polysaccharide export outer membrane protein [Pedobacter cryoconitis]
MKRANIVFVHGLCADGAGWNALIPAILEEGNEIILVQNALTSSLESDVMAVQKANRACGLMDKNINKYIPVKKFFLLLCALSTLLLSSCLVSKKVVYLQDMKPDSPYKVISAPPVRIQKNDRLSILISAKKPELAAPFNSEGGVYNVNEKGVVSTTTPSSFSEKGYLVDQLGNIEFPVLGTLNVEGLTLDGLKDMIRDKLLNQNLIGSPIVKIELLNLKVMMMGEINNVGVLTVPDSRITLLEAINRSGGLTRNATVNEISVIREENGVRKVYQNDIQKSDIFNSPTYYLQQNDIVYIKPKTAVLSTKEESTWRYVGILTGLFTLVTSILLLTRH